jgi:restriction endonuclease
MSQTTAFQLESLTYQTDAVDSVVSVFQGTSKLAADHAGNRCSLTWAQISANIKAIALRQRISEERLNLTAPAQGQALDVCVEMETGTGCVGGTKL